MALPLVIGVGEAGVGVLPPQLVNRLADMDLVVAARRFRKGIPTGPEIIDWPSPFSNIYNVLKSNSEKSVALLATGDPMWYGAGASLVRELGPHGCEVIPAAAQLAAARLGWPMAGREIVSVHGRPHAALAARLIPCADLVIAGRVNAGRLAEIASQGIWRGIASCAFASWRRTRSGLTAPPTAGPMTVPAYIGISRPDEAVAPSVLAVPTLNSRQTAR